MTDTWSLVADIGGTTTRLAALRDGALTGISRSDTASREAVLAACRAYAADTPPAAAMVAIAGPLENGHAYMVNADFELSEAEISDALGGAPTRMINDFEAAAWSLATVTEADAVILQGDAPPPRGPRLILGPGTGLGVGALIPAGDGFAAAPGEGGHMRLCPADAEEAEIFRAMIRLWPEARIGGDCIEAEALLSGTGLPVLHQALTGAAAPLTAEAILRQARDGSDPAAARAAAIFRRHLGAFAGDLALAFGATGGVFIAGGVAQRNPWLFDRAFLDAFNAGGRYTDWRSALPVRLLTLAEPGLTGAANALSFTT